MGVSDRADLHGRGSSAERARRKATVDAWVEDYGWVCPGYLVAPHESTDLTADHVISVAAGGDPAGPLGVLCRSCNGRKGKRSEQLAPPPVRSRDWIKL